MQNARKQRFANEYVQAIMRHEKACNIVDEAAVTFAWKNFDVALRKNIRRLEKHVIADDFVELLNEVIEYYDSLNKEHDEKKAAYQRDLKTAKRRLLSQSQQQQQQRLTTYSARQKSRQEWRQKRNQMLSPLSNNREYQPRQFQYTTSSSNQKFLTNNAKTRNAHFADDAPSEDEVYYFSSAEIKYLTAEYAQFDDIVAAFHAQASHEKDFNSEDDSRNEMSLYFCNICQVNYLDDYRGLDNHIFDIHQIDINSNTSMKRKRYFNWIEHATLNIYEIKTLSNDYATLQSRLFNNESNIFICADTGFEVSFMNESLLSQDINLFERLIFTSLVTIRDISDERIVDKQIHLSIYVTGSDDITKTIEATSYVTKRIKVEVMLDMNILEKFQNKITLHLHTKKMQLRSSHVSLKFTSSETMSVSFNVAIVVCKSCLKTSTTKQRFKKTIKFAKMSQKKTFSSVKLDRISQISHREMTANSVLSNANWHRKCAFNNASKMTYCPEKITKTLEWRRHVALSIASTASAQDHTSMYRHANKSYKALKSRRRRLNQLWR